MQIGIFERTFAGSLTEKLDAVAAHGVRCVQFDLGSAGIADKPESITETACAAIGRELKSRGIVMSAVSGTFNMAHPVAAQRAEGLAFLKALAANCKHLGTGVITLCTGTRDTQSMWRKHPENDTPEAWNDLFGTMVQAARIAEDCGVTLALEPEVSNVIHSPKRARKLLDDVKSPRLKICMDGANVFHHGELPKMREILDEAFDLLGGDIVLAHAKDLDHDGDAGHLAAGTGKLDCGHYVARLKRSGFTGALVLHGLSAAQAPECIRFLKDKLAAASS